MAWTGRQLAKELGISPTTSSKFLNELSREGIAVVSGVGRAYLYKLNNENYAVKNILVPFFQKEEGMLDALFLLIKKILLRSAITIESAVIFGSVSKKEQGARSDVDLLVIIKDAKDKKKLEDNIFSASDVIARRFHTSVSPYVLTPNQFRKKYKKKSALMKEIMDSYILLFGESLERIIV